MKHEGNIPPEASLHASAGYGWENDCRVPVVAPDIYGDEPSEPDDGRRDIADAIGKFLDLLTAIEKPKKIGYSIWILAFLAGRTSFKNGAALAKKLKISNGRLSQISADLIGDFESLGCLRPKKTKLPPSNRD